MRFEIFVELALVARAEAGFETGHIAADVIENARVLLHALHAGSRVGGFAIAKEPLEDGARADLAWDSGVVGPRQEMVLV